MIGSLAGKLQSRNDDTIIINVGGVGFRVRVSAKTAAGLGEVGSPVQLRTHLRVREDELSLYGFATEEELHLFETLLTVSGVGPKVAMSVLSAAPIATLKIAIAEGNIDALTAVPGIGKKTAQRLALELKGKIDVTGLSEVSEISPPDRDVIDALINLGYSAAEATRAARAVPANVKLLEERVRVALQYLGG
jgi:holliday junction DNA helicase RuvA